MRLKASVRKFLENDRVCWVATAGLGSLHVVPVCHVVAEGKIYFATDAQSQKARNLQRAPRLALVADLYSEDWPHKGRSRFRGHGIRGRAPLEG